ncbi:MAG: 1,4-dihydroxy-2-naphthoate polyprenyltransferase [Actinobacteria bacterium]|nr:1,4-dihydroxy-2-naphthoate polyprenyltransferase [Actinomycetota bacterium]
MTGDRRPPSPGAAPGRRAPGAVRPAPNGLALWVAGARPRTLPAAVVPVLVGTAAAAGRVHGGLIWWRAAAAMVVSLALQVATNYANDYSDGIRGTDADERRVGPVRLVGQGLAAPAAVKRAALASFAVAGLAGGALALAVGPELFVVGALAIAAGWFYTGGPRPYGYAGFGEVFVFVFFGVVATAGSAYVQQGQLTGLALAASVPVGFLATALLVVNNLRDIPGDRASGKRTLAVRLGDSRTRMLYVALLVGAFVAVPLVAGLGGRPAGALALAAVMLAQQPVVRVLQRAQGRELVPVLASTGRVQLAFGVLLAAGLALSA